MHFLQRSFTAALAMIVISASTAMARGYDGNINSIAPASHGYSGNWPVTVTHSQRSNGTYCLTLTQSGRNSGSASLVIGSEKFSFGTFQIFNNTLVATIQAQGGSQNAGLVFIGSASRGTIGTGVFDEVYGGEAFDEGALAFGMKGGC